MIAGDSLTRPPHPSPPPRGGREKASLAARTAQALREGVIGGIWRPGTQLPSETVLAELCGVSIGTLRKALAALERERLIERRQGRGTFVPAQTAERALFHFFRIVDLDGRRTAPTSLVLDFRDGAATAEEAAALALDAGAPVLRIRRLRAIGAAEPILERITLPAVLFPGLRLPVLRRVEDELYVLYERDFDVTVARAEERLAAVAVGEEEARLLGLAPGAPLLEIARIAHDRAGRPVERRVTLLDTAAHRYVARLE